MQSMDLWDFEIWKFILYLSVIFVSILLGNILRRKIKFIKNSLLPASVIAGLIVFLIKFIPPIANYFEAESLHAQQVFEQTNETVKLITFHSFMESVTYHCLGLGFIAVSMKSSPKQKDSNKLVIMDSGIVTVNGYLVQAICGLGLTIVCSLTFMKDLFPAAGLLLPMGYGQGTGQALNIGKVFESLGFAGGPAFGLSIAAVGFLVACIVGVIFMNILRVKGKLTVQEQRIEKAKNLPTNIYGDDETPLGEAVDKMTIQFGVIILIYAVTCAVMFGLSWLAVNYLGNFGVNTIRPLVFGFNFLFGTVFAMLAKKIMSSFKKGKIMRYTHVNNHLMDRLSGLFFDAMVVAGIAAIDWQNLGDGLWLPLVIVCVVGAVVTFFYVLFICRKVYPEYPYEAFFSYFGMLTGTASTGMILLRELDPNLETPAANNLVMQQIPAIAFGAPILLLIPFAGKSFDNSLLVLGICVVLFVVYNVILLRKFIFKKKNKLPKE